MIYIEKVRVNSFNSDGDAVFSLRLSSKPDNLTLSICVNGEQKLCTNADARDLSFSIHIDDPVLWSVADPVLLCFRVVFRHIRVGRIRQKDILAGTGQSALYRKGNGANPAEGGVGRCVVRLY